MRIYVSHASSFDYRTELYEPLRATIGTEHELVLPHDSNDQGISAKGIIPRCDLVLAEVSHPSTGQGIELGWADAQGVPIVCMYRTGSIPSGALGFVTATTVVYSGSEDMISKCEDALGETGASERVRRD